MHALRALLLAVIPAVSPAGEATILRVDHGDARLLQAALLDLAQQRLQDTGLVIDREHAWLALGGKLPAGDLQALPTWSSVGGLPSLPLAFELRPAADAQTTQPVRATLAVRLRRAVLVAQRRIGKGSRVTCGDFALSLRDLGAPNRTAPLATCTLEAGGSAQRDFAAGDALRAGDVGRAPEVRSGAPVQLHVSNGGILVTTAAIALADARTGDEVDVRLQRPTRTLRARVVERGTVRLADEAP